MKLIDILEKLDNMKYGNEYNKHREIIKELLNDLYYDEIIKYEIIENNNIVKNIKIANNNGEIKNITYYRIYNTVNNKPVKITISDENSKITINYNPFNIEVYNKIDNKIKVIKKEAH